MTRPCFCAALSLALGACTVPQDSAPPNPALPVEAGMVTCPHVPDKRADPPPKPPVSAFPQILQPGHWEWRDARYAWEPPAWRARLSTGAPRWVDGFWTPSGGACVWHNGHYQWPGQAG